MRRTDGTRGIHSFAHGRITYAIKHGATSVRNAMETAMKDEAVVTCALLAGSADHDAVDLAELRQLARKLAETNLSAIGAAFKSSEGATGRAGN